MKGMALRRGRSWAAAALLAVAAIWAQLGPAGAVSTLKLRGSTLVLSTAPIEADIAEVPAAPSPGTVAPGTPASSAPGALLEGARFSLGRGLAGSPGLAERSDYASAYVSPTTLLPVDGVNPLDSFATVEANNSYLRISNGPTAYRALELLLVQNNTLEVTGGASLSLARSSVLLRENNWLQVTNASGLSLDMSRLTFTNYFTWLVEDSALSVSGSIVSLQDVITWWSGADVVLADTTLGVSTAYVPVPQRYEGRIAPVQYISGSTVNLTRSSWTVRGVPVVLAGSSLGLTNSSLTLYDTTLHVGSLLQLLNAEVTAYNSTIILHTNSTTTTPVESVQLTRGSAVIIAPPSQLSPSLQSYLNAALPSNVTDTSTLSNNTRLAAPGLEQALVGVPLGSLSGVQLEGADADITLQE